MAGPLSRASHPLVASVLAVRPRGSVVGDRTAAACLIHACHGLYSSFTRTLCVWALTVLPPCRSGCAAGRSAWPRVCAVWCVWRVSCGVCVCSVRWVMAAPLPPVLCSGRAVNRCDV